MDDNESISAETLFSLKDLSYSIAIQEFNLGHVETAIDYLKRAASHFEEGIRAREKELEHQNEFQTRLDCIEKPVENQAYSSNIALTRRLLLEYILN